VTAEPEHLVPGFALETQRLLPDRLRARQHLDQLRGIAQQRAAAVLLASWATAARARSSSAWPSTSNGPSATSGGAGA
jgi:hypothetical protein